MPVSNSTTAILFSVIVPVLSRQIVCTEPKASTALSPRTRTFCFLMSWIPKARVVVAIVGSPSGTAATAKEIAVLSISAKPYPRSNPMPNTRPHTPDPISTN